VSRVGASAILATLRIAGLCLLSGCVSFVWTRERQFQKTPKQALEGLEVGKSTLSECLARLGAPLYVWEYKGDGAALAWGSLDDASKRVAVTVPLQARWSPSFSYADGDARLRGPVLFFDKTLVLEGFETGSLRDLRGQAMRTRPAPP
jgi:hypothetical protein